MALFVSFLSLVITVASAQTGTSKARLPPYDDPDGYLILSFIIDLKTNPGKTGPVSISQRTVGREKFNNHEKGCLDRIPAEFQKAAEDFDTKAKTRFLLRERFSLQKKYGFVGTPTVKSLEVFSVSAVGFDESKTHAIAFVEYLVRPTDSIVLGGDSLFYLLRKTAAGWQQASEVPRCGRIY